jgi:hypothetical protein
MIYILSFSPSAISTENCFNKKKRVRLDFVPRLRAVCHLSNFSFEFSAHSSIGVLSERRISAPVYVD